MKRQSQPRGNLPPRINTPNNQDFIQEYFSGPSPFSPQNNVDNNMFNNNMYYPPNGQMVPPNNGPMYNNAVDGMENYDLKDNNHKHMPRGMPTPSTPIHPMNDMGQFNVPMQYRNYEMYGDHQHQQPLMTPPPYMRGNVPFMNGGPHGNEEMMVGMNHIMKDQNNNLLSPVVLENTGGAQNNKKANLYKTELCRSYEETGHCRYGSKCQFAHSESELRHVDRHPKYKTEMCKTFWEQGTCPYGKRCCFIHTPRDLSKKEDAPGQTPTTPIKKSFQEPTVTITKPKVSTPDNSNTLSEGETIAITSEEGETSLNNHSRSGSDGATATSMTEEVITTDDTENKATEEVAPTDDSNTAAITKTDANANANATTKTDATTTTSTEVTSTTDEKKPEKTDDSKEDVKKDGEGEDATTSTEKESVKTTTTASIAIKTTKMSTPKAMASSFEPMAKTPTSNPTFNYSTSFNGNGIMNNGNFTPRRKMSSPAQRQTPRNMNIPNKGMNMNGDMYNNHNNNYNGMLGMNSMSYQPTSTLDSDFMFNPNPNDMSKAMGQNHMSTSFPANDFLDEKVMYKLQNLSIQTTPPHTPINNQRNSQSMISPMSSSFTQNSIFMKQPLNVNTNQNNSNLFLKQTVTASPFAQGSSGSFLSPKQNFMGMPPIPMIDDESASLKGSVSGKGSDYGDDVKSNATEEASNVSVTTSNNPNNIFMKQAITTPKAGNPSHPFLKVTQTPTTPKNSAFLPSTPQSISNSFLNSSSVSPLPSSRMGTSLPSTPIHPNSFSSSVIDDIYNSNTGNGVNEFSRPNTSGINIAASPFTPSNNDISQYMMQMSSNRDNGGISLENIKSPSQLFYRQSAGSLNPINTTSSLKSNGGFGNMNMGMGMVKNRSESFDYGMLSPNGMNSFLNSGNSVTSPVSGFNNPLASSFNNSFLANKNRSESIDFGQINHTPKDTTNMVGSMPSLSFLQSINEGIPDSPFSNHGSSHGSPLHSTSTTLNDLNVSGMTMSDFGSRRKSFPEQSLMSVRLPTVPEGRHPNVIEEEEEPQRIFNNNSLTDEGILKFSKEHFGLDDSHSKSLLGAQGSSGLGGSILGGNIFHPMSPSSTSHNFF